MSQKLSIHLVSWNGSKYIPYLFDSLKKQTYKDWKLFVWENASSDDTAELIKKELENFDLPYEYLDSKKNIGFAGGHNELYRGMGNEERGTSEYFLLLNQDMYLMPDVLEKLVKFLNENKDVASVTPRLMKWNFNQIDIDFSDSLTNYVDSLGLKIMKNRRVVEKYVGKDWDEKKAKMELSFRAHDESLEVFGVSGALPMYRKSAIDMVKFSDGNFFDNLYESYKEDVDLSWRLRLFGFKSFVLLDAVTYHDRSAGGQEKLGDKTSAENKKKQSAWVKYHSYKNHLMTLYKNEYGKNFSLDFLFIIWYELKKFVYFLVFDRKVLKGLSVIWENKKLLKQRREEVTQMRNVSYKELRVWWK
ncbi:MAG: glycosyltransferase family 2 protein [Candidatus Magasanikbacteria bacterium]